MGPGVPAILGMAATFLAVTLFVEGAYFYYRDVHAPKARIDRRLKDLQTGEIHRKIETSLMRHKETYDDGLSGRIFDYLEGLLAQAGMEWSPGRLVKIMAVGTGGALVALVAFFGVAGLLRSLSGAVPVLLAAVAIGAGGPLLFIVRKGVKRVKKFAAQFPAALDIFVRGLRAGHPVSSALQLLVEEMPDPLGTEFAKVVSEISYGYALRDALTSLANRLRTPDIQMFAVCVAIQAETGGNLADVLDDLSKLIRERQSMALKVRALASEGKMTAIVLSVLPVATFLFVFLTQPAFYLEAAKDSVFLPGLAGIILWYSTGVLMIRRLVDLKV